MNLKKLRSSLVFVALILTVLAIGSCSKFEGDQTVPSYIRIDTIILETNYEREGAATHNITDAWVYINNEAIGAYELPVVFPVLAKGTTEVRIDPGIKLNGIAALRSPYPFYESIIQDVELVEGEIVDLYADPDYTVTTHYNDNLVFVWMEDFEDPSISLDSTSKSHTDIRRTEPANSPEAYLSDYSKYSGLMILHDTIEIIDVATNVGQEDGFILPQVGEPVFLEIDYCNNNYFTAGLYVNELSQIIQSPVLNMNPRDHWNKIYVNLTPSVSAATNALDFNIFLGSVLEDNVEEARIRVDNIKLIHRK